jgi:hypothetical protein
MQIAIVAGNYSSGGLMKRIVICLACLITVVAAVEAQKKYKPWTEWTEKDAQKILDDSPWGQTQTETDTSEMVYNPTTQAGAGASSGRSERGALNQATNLNYRIRMLSARPIRQAFSRTITAKQPEMAEQMKAFVERDFGEFIVVAVTFDSTDRRASGPVMQILNSANTGILQNNTYLEVKGGKRQFLDQYQAPSNDGLGAKFIFKRTMAGEPFITPETNEFRFYSEVKQIKLNMRFRTKDMVYDGKLEF